MARHKEFEREEVLEKALDIFWCNGYNATSFQTLTEGMCINRQSIYDTYGDKHTLFIEALNHYNEQSAAAVAAHFDQNKPVKELLHSFFYNLIDAINTDTQRKGCFIANATLEMIPHDEDVKKIVTQSVEQLTKTFRALITRGIKSGEIAPDHSPEALAIYLISSINGLKTLGKTVTDKKKLQSVVDIAISAIN